MADRIRQVPGKGRAVVAGRRYRTGELIEIAPVVILPPKEADLVDRTILGRYVFYWADRRSSVLPLGYGAIYNHDPDPNAYCTIWQKRRAIAFYARRPIGKGEEITINYHGEPEDPRPFEFPPDRQPARSR